MAQLTPLEQVQLDAKRIYLQRYRDEVERKAWQESTNGTITLEDSPEPVAVEVEVKKEESKPKTKTVTKKKGHK